jgi:serine/threonine-protein kinase
MEFLEGETLAAVLAKRGPLAPTTAARLARGMAEALEAAHAKGIVHRDLKPENVFVQPQPPDSVKLVDFGIAKLAGDLRAQQVHQTRSGALMGTPLYMSPEQCRDSANLDSRTDLYSLGCVLYEMLVGHPPFTHANLGDLVVAHMTETPQDARALNPAVPPALGELTADLLRKNPAERPPGMRAVADRLAAFLGGLTTVPDPPPRGPVAERQPTKSKTTFGDSAAEVIGGDAPPRRRGSMTLVVVAVLGLGAGGISVSRWLAPRATGTAPVAATESPPPVAAPATPTAPPPSPSPTTNPAPAPSTAAAAAPSPTPAPAAAPKEEPRKKGHRHGVEVASAAAPAPAPAGRRDRAGAGRDDGRGPDGFLRHLGRPLARPRAPPERPALPAGRWRRWGERMVLERNGGPELSPGRARGAAG